MEDTLDENPAKAGDQKNGLDNHRAAKQTAKLPAGNGQDGQERVLEAVTQHHDPLYQSLGPGSAHVVLPQNLHHGGAGHPGDEGHFIEGKGQGGKDHLLQVGQRVVPQLGVSQRRQPAEGLDQEQDK